MEEGDPVGVSDAEDKGGGVGTPAVGDVVGTGNTSVPGTGAGVVGNGVGAGTEEMTVGLGCNSFSVAAVIPTPNRKMAAVRVQRGGFFNHWLRLRGGNATSSALYSSKAVAKSNSCSALSVTTGPVSSVAKCPKNRSWDKSPLGCI
jgi:hypothetical protein